MKLIHIAAALNFLAFAYSAKDIKCYDCDPSSPEACVHPEKANIKTTNCINDKYTTMNVEEPRDQLKDREFECFSVFFEADENATSIKEGVYRGCAPISRDVQSTCDYLGQFFNDGNITNCLSCAYNECNKEYVGGGAAAISFSVPIGIFISIVWML